MKKILSNILCFVLGVISTLGIMFAFLIGAFVKDNITGGHRGRSYTSYSKYYKKEENNVESDNK